MPNSNLTRCFPACHECSEAEVLPGLVAVFLDDLRLLRFGGAAVFEHEQIFMHAQHFAYQGHADRRLWPGIGDHVAAAAGPLWRRFAENAGDGVAEGLEVVVARRRTQFDPY